MHAYVDGSYAMHANGCGYFGLFVNMGKVTMMSVSKKLGLRTAISTETEVVSNGERFPRHTWFRYFMLT